MSTPDAEDASPSPEHSPGNSPDYSGSPEDSDMAADMDVDSKPDGTSPTQRTANGQKSSSSAKDPLRPRRKKARRACLACQRAHLTCGDERPCHRCVKRQLQATCTDGVRKKAKYLHDAPDSALMPGISGHFHHMNGNPTVHFQGQGPDQGVGPRPEYYAQSPPGTFYPGNQMQAHVPVSVQEVPVPNNFAHPQAPISPPYSQTNQGPLANPQAAAAQGPPANLQQFGGPLFDPSDPALFNFDISSLNFGSHYGALELGMLGHISSGVAETPPGDNNILNPLNQAAGIYNPQMRPGQYGENNLPVPSHGIPQSEWENPQSRQGSLQVQTPHNTPTTANIDHGSHRQDSINAPHAYVIGQGPASISSASPASTDMNPGYDNDNPLSSATFFANSVQAREHRQSPTVGRPQHHQNTTLQPIQTNALQKRRRDTSWIYETINEPFPYVGSWHHLTATILSRFCRASAEKIKIALSKFRPSLLHAAERLTTNDAILQERNLQRSLVDLEEKFSEVGVPYILCRRTGEVVAMNKEFTILTGWDRGVLLGKEPNLNVNFGLLPPTGIPESDPSTRTNTTPLMAGQEPKKTPFPVNMIELLDERSAVEWAGDLSELIYLNNHAQRRRVNMLRYRTKEDVAKAEEMKANALAHGGHVKHEPLIKLEGGPVHCAETSMMQLGARDGLVDCMLSLHVKRDTLDEPLLLCMHLMPVLEKRAH
ncbi:transcription activator of gluconeogenesis [Dendryphion nanum]|uniref:Transcription activator of gluconeogenesis n=1 Tax=Dendryphion nanum TaxID=256645 RepID=A0A9P9DIB8_9PLEO|nr:transcription activator of gluconeogenesis [Dendryphion nanum]